MKRTLSSSATVWWKFIFPTIWISGFGAGTFAVWFGSFHSHNNEPQDWMRWQFLVIWLVASTFLIWFARRLCRVSLCDGSLTASNYFHEVSVPVTTISHVTQSYMSHPPTITVHLDHQTALGCKIVFIPVGSARFLSEHRITTELKNLMSPLHKNNQPPHEYRGVCVFKWFFAVSSVLLLVSAITGISSLQASPDHTVITHHTFTSRLITIVLIPVNIAFCYGLQKRLLQSWYAVFGLFAIAYVNFVLTVWFAPIFPYPTGYERAMLVAFAGAVGAAVTIYWWRWWQKQKGYFLTTSKSK